MLILRAGSGYLFGWTGQALIAIFILTCLPIFHDKKRNFIRNFISVSSRSSARALIGDTVNWNQQLTQVKSNVDF